MFGLFCFHGVCRFIKNLKKRLLTSPGWTWKMNFVFRLQMYFQSMASLPFEFRRQSAAGKRIRYHHPCNCMCLIFVCETFAQAHTQNIVSCALFSIFRLMRMYWAHLSIYCGHIWTWGVSFLVTFFYFYCWFSFILHVLLFYSLHNRYAAKERINIISRWFSFRFKVPFDLFHVQFFPFVTSAKP